MSLQRLWRPVLNALKTGDSNILWKQDVTAGAVNVNNLWKTFIGLSCNRMVAGIFLMAFSAVSAYAENSLQVLAVTGNVQINEAGSAAWISMTEKSVIGAGDRIRASGSSSCNLGWESYGSVTLAENTIALVKEVTAKTANVSIEVGQMSAVSTGTPGKILVVSTAFASLFAKKSAEFGLYVTETGVGRVSVATGIIIAKAQDVVKPALIKEGYRVEIRKGFVGQPEKAAGGVTAGATGVPVADGAFAVLSLEVPVENEVFSTTAIEVTGTYRQQGTVLVNGKEVPRGAEGAFSTIVEFPEGYDTVRVTAVDPAGKRTTLVRPVLVNTFIPEIDLFLPLYGPYVNRSDYRLRGALADNTPYDEVHALVNGSEIDLDRWGFSEVLGLEEGWNRITIEAIDLAENFAILDTALFFDSQPPEVAIYQPRGASVSLGNPPTVPGDPAEYFRVEGRLIDPEPSGGIREFTINSVAIPVDEDGSFSTDIVIRSGVPNRLFIYAVDRAGNEFNDDSRVLTY